MVREAGETACEVRRVRRGDLIDAVAECVVEDVPVTVNVVADARRRWSR
jgi:hypothetical protein